MPGRREMKFEVKGLDDIQRHLKELGRRAKSMDGTRSLQLNEIVTPRFMSRYMGHPDVDAWFTAGGFTIEGQAHFDSLPKATLDGHVRATSRFGGWDDMMAKATSEYVEKTLFG
jgi:hypothetical protein